MKDEGEEMDGELVDKWAEYLKENRPANVLMPGVLRQQGNGDLVKAPMLAHKDGKWTWERYEQIDMSKAKMLGILLKDIIVIDIDGKEYLQPYEAVYEDLNDCPQEMTKNGAHYFYLRTKLCDELKLFDMARGLKSKDLPRKEGQDTLPIDIKTRCSTGSGGFLIVTPSENKSWVSGREPWNMPMREIPDEFVRRLDKLRQKPSRSAKRSNVSRAPRQLSPIFALEANPEVERVLRLLSVERWERRDSWLKIGIALQNEGGLMTYKELFLSMAKERAPRAFTTYEVEEDYWNTFVNPFYIGERVTMGTIRAWAKEDNPEDYRVLHPEDVLAEYLSAFRKTVTETPKTDSPYAKMFQEKYAGRFLNRGNTIREFNGG